MTVHKSLSAAVTTGQPVFVITRDGAILRATTDRAALIRLFNRAYRRIEGLHATTIWVG